MIEAKIYDLLNAKVVLDSLKNKSLPGKAALNIARLIREVSKELETYDAARLDIINKYAKKDENGNMIVENGNAQIEEEFIKECQNKLNESCLAIIELNTNPIEEQWLEDINLLVEEAIALEPFVKK